ncbi:MAG: octaprenyl diphosphate synthase [Methylococcus sp.]|nr:MAG: octaprenyl diphosphate synthase [Methylococcus sp.]
MASSMTSAEKNPVENNGQIDFQSIQELTRQDIAAVDQIILKELTSDVVLINQIGQYIVNSGGKRLRPVLLLLAAKALSYEGTHHLMLAAVVEFIHTATLLHDDVVDDSDLRRGKNTVNAVWGNAASVLVGDYLLSKTFEMMVCTGNMRVMDLVSHTTTAIAEGEVLQLLNVHNPATTEERYLEVISRKTAILFSAAAQLAAVLTESSEETELALKNYGLHLGIAFQLIDDVLDYKADPEQTGKNIGDDLSEGKPTLPLIHAILHSEKSQADIIRNAIREGDRNSFAEIYKIVESCNAIAYTERRAEEEAQRAIDALAVIPTSTSKDVLISLAEFSVQRNF